MRQIVRSNFCPNAIQMAGNLGRASSLSAADLFPSRSVSPFDLSSVLHLRTLYTTWVIGKISFVQIVVQLDTDSRWNVVDVRHYKTNGLVPAKYAYSSTSL